MAVMIYVQSYIQYDSYFTIKPMLVNTTFNRRTKVAFVSVDLNIRFMHRSPGAKIQDYTNEIKHVCTFSTVEEFWGAFSHMKRPGELSNISDYHFFKKGIRPIWEDNLTGGKWIIRLKKGIASRYWEDLLLAIVGDQFDVGDEICGAVVSIRHSEDIVSLWNKSADEGRINLRIRDTLKRVLSLPANCVMEYKAHKAAVADNSSFRNTETYR
ncbi:hypothetical protein BDEG_28245 [Batrachochytrium dendrobatidis JEL423]|uniref:Eukaryotic translation initiation factor 4E type 2 n=1 Tax=Batrachochytrium dendrobatidis (strain JEL423) TaxID=403673 RepID=A0A177WY94_BATDL|nr:hypothetical protein BDEG_28245 [Batrachochytrium dendrobatidis JEL423]